MHHAYKLAMKCNYYVLKIAELEIQLVCMETGRVSSIAVVDSVFEQGLVNDSSADTEEACEDRLAAL